MPTYKNRHFLPNNQFVDIYARVDVSDAHLPVHARSFKLRHSAATKISVSENNLFIYRCPNKKYSFGKRH